MTFPQGTSLNALPSMHFQPDFRSPSLSYSRLWRFATRIVGILLPSRAVPSNPPSAPSMSRSPTAVPVLPQGYGPVPRQAPVLAEAAGNLLCVSAGVPQNCTLQAGSRIPPKDCFFRIKPGCPGKTVVHPQAGLGFCYASGVPGRLKSGNGSLRSRREWPLWRPAEERRELTTRPRKRGAGRGTSSG
jgi:hypothetical protein